MQDEEEKGSPPSIVGNSKRKARKLRQEAINMYNFFNRINADGDDFIDILEFVQGVEDNYRWREFFSFFSVKFTKNSPVFAI
jgi:hypothetical protein